MSVKTSQSSLHHTVINGVPPIGPVQGHTGSTLSSSRPGSTSNPSCAPHIRKTGGCDGRTGAVMAMSRHRPRMVRVSDGIDDPVIPELCSTEIRDCLPAHIGLV